MWCYTCPKVICTHSCKCLWKWFTQPPCKCKFIYEGKFKCNEYGHESVKGPNDI
jgi:hypothetical protein